MHKRLLESLSVSWLWSSHAPKHFVFITWEIYLTPSPLLVRTLNLVGASKQYWILTCLSAAWGGRLVGVIAVPARVRRRDPWGMKLPNLMLGSTGPKDGSGEKFNWLRCATTQPNKPRNLQLASICARTCKNQAGKGYEFMLHDEKAR